MKNYFVQPLRPTAPQEFFDKPWREEIYSIFSTNLQELLDMLPEGVAPSRATIESEHSFTRDSDTYFLEVSDYEKERNPNYEAEILQYNAAMIQYGEKMNEYRAHLAASEAEAAKRKATLDAAHVLCHSTPMKSLKALEKRYAEIRTLRVNTPVSIKPGKYSTENSYVMRVGELERIVDKMRVKLAEIAAGYGFGGEYNEICAMLAEHNEYAETAHVYCTQGGDWRDSGATPRHQRTSKESFNFGTGVFGLTWTQIEKMQGGKITIDGKQSSDIL